MLRIFLTNLVRSILFCALAFVVAAALNLGVAYAFQAIFSGAYPLWLCAIVAGFSSAGVFSMLMGWGKDTEAILPPLEEPRDSSWIKRAARGKHVKFIAVWVSLLIHLVMAGVIVWAYFEYGESLATLFVEETEQLYLHKGMYLTDALTAVGIVQIGYFFSYWGRYKEMRCPTCKNVHCFIYAGDREVSETTRYEYQPDENSSKHVEFVLDGTRYEGTGHKWYGRKITNKHISYARKCVICGKVSREYQFEEQKGSWEKED